MRDRRRTSRSNYNKAPVNGALQTRPQRPPRDVSTRQRAAVGVGLCSSATSSFLFLGATGCRDERQKRGTEKCRCRSGDAAAAPLSAERHAYETQTFPKRNLYHSEGAFTVVPGLSFLGLETMKSALTGLCRSWCSLSTLSLCVCAPARAEGGYICART